jgi:putative transposase
MGHSYVSNRVHIAFSTSERRELITNEMQPKLWAYVAGTARKIGVEVFEVGGVDDHTHVFVAVPASVTVASVIQKIKANSSRWMRQNGVPRFEWQQGYGAFSVSASATEDVRRYVREQTEHHKKHSFEEEFVSLLKRYGVEYDPRHVFG